ncbi:tetratricopeptide repeat protein, partial [Bdellovibrionota bacterium]
MRRVIKRYIKSQHIEKTWEFKIRLANKEETGPYTFNNVADLLLEGTFSGEEEIAWYPDGGWIAIGGWDLFQGLLREFLEAKKGTPEQQQEWYGILERFPTSVHLPPPIEEGGVTELLEPQEREWHPSVEKTFVEEEIVEEERPRPNFVKVWTPRLLLFLLIIGLVYILAVKPEDVEVVKKGDVEVIVPSTLMTPLRPEQAQVFIEKAQSLLSEDTPIAFQHGVTELHQALLHDPQNRSARLLLAELYALLWPLTDQSTKSDLSIRTLIDQSNNIPGGAMVLGRLAYEQGKLQLAKKHLDSIEGTNPALDLLRAEIAIASGEHERAIKLLQQIIEMDPESTRAHYFLGIALEEKGRQGEALEEFQRVVRINPRHGASKLHLALLQLQLLTNVGKAEELLKLVIQFPSFVFPKQLAEAHYYLGRIFENRTQMDFAIQEYSLAYQSDPENILYKQALVKVGGEDALKRMAQKRPGEKDADYYVSLGNRYLRDGRRWDAIAQYQLAIQKDPKSAIAYYNLGKAYSDERDYQGAIQNFQHAINYDKQDVNSYIEMGKIFTRTYQYKNAQEVLQKARNLEPANPKVFMAAGYFFEHKNELNRAKYEYSRAVELDPNFAEGHLALGRIYMEFGEYDSAKKAIEKGIELDPENEKNYVTLAEAVFRIGFQTKALNFLNQRIAANPHSAIYFQGLGKIYELSGNTDLAIEKYRKATQLNPSDSDTYRSLASIHEENGEYKEALFYYNQMVKYDPKNAEGFFNQAF